MDHYGETIRKIRDSWSKPRFAQAMGITVEALEAYEANKRVPREEVKRRLCFACVDGGLLFLEDLNTKSAQRKEKT